MPNELTHYEHMLALAKDHMWTIGAIGDLSKALITADAMRKSAELVLDEKHTECNALQAERDRLRAALVDIWDASIGDLRGDGWCLHSVHLKPETKSVIDDTVKGSK